MSRPKTFFYDLFVAVQPKKRNFCRRLKSSALDHLRELCCVRCAFARCKWCGSRSNRWRVRCSVKVRSKRKSCPQNWEVAATGVYYALYATLPYGGGIHLWRRLVVKKICTVTVLVISFVKRALHEKQEERTVDCVAFLIMTMFLSQMILLLKVGGWSWWYFIGIRAYSLVARVRCHAASVHIKNNVLSSNWKMYDVPAFVFSPLVFSNIMRILRHWWSIFAIPTLCCYIGGPPTARKSNDFMSSAMPTIWAVREDSECFFPKPGLKIITDFTIATNGVARRKMPVFSFARFLSMDPFVSVIKRLNFCEPRRANREDSSVPKGLSSDRYVALETDAFHLLEPWTQLHEER